MHDTVIGTSDELRLVMAYGKSVPLFKFGQPATLDGWTKLYEILERRPAVCVREAGTLDSAKALASKVRVYLDPNKYVVTVEPGTTQVMVHRRADYERTVINDPYQKNTWWEQYPPAEWCKLADAALRLGYNKWTARDVLAREGVERHPINRSGKLVYRKAEVEAIATRPFDPGPFYRVPPKQRIPLGWYPDDPRLNPRRTYTPERARVPRWMRMSETTNHEENQ